MRQQSRVIARVILRSEYVGRMWLKKKMREKEKRNDDHDDDDGSKIRAAVSPPVAACPWKTLVYVKRYRV